MRILYLSLSYIPSRRASSVQVMKMCAALARAGHEVVLVAKRGEPDGIDDHAHYHVEPSFEIKKLARPRRRGGGLVYTAGLGAELVRRRSRADLVYCRDPIGALLACELRMPVVFESHGIPQATWLRRVTARVAASRHTLGVVAITEALRHDLIAAGMVDPARVVVAPDACDPPRERVQRRMRSSPPVVGYVGSLYPGRGIEVVLGLARELSDVRFRLVGGSEPDLARWRATGVPANVELLGFRPQAELPALYRAMDVVVMPYARDGVVGETRSTDTSRWTSPMKMFEYMASGVAIVSSDLPVLHEVLRDGANALLVPPDDLGAWRRAIERLLADDDLRFRLATTAQDELVRNYTWDGRAATVLTSFHLGQARAAREM